MRSASAVTREGTRWSKAGLCLEPFARGNKAPRPSALNVAGAVGDPSRGDAANEPASETRQRMFRDGKTTLPSIADGRHRDAVFRMRQLADETGADVVAKDKPNPSTNLLPKNMPKL